MPAPSAPPPDVKDWTWVLTRPCPDCGFDASAVTLADLPGLVDGVVTTFTGRLRELDAAQRPSATVWSPLEYGCHIRDVCRIFAERLQRMLDEDDPQFANWNQDATALEDCYWAQDPATVSADLRAAADRIAAAFVAVPPERRGRTGRRSDGAAFTVDTLGRYFVHDLVHHGYDVSDPSP